MLGTIEKSDQVLRLFSTERAEWSVVDVAQALGTPTSSAHELLSSLTAIGLLRRTDKGRYRLGWRLVSMASDTVVGNGFAGRGAPEVRRLARRLGHTGYLTVWDGEWPLVLTSTVPQGGVTGPQMRRGAQLPGYASASAKVLLAAMPATEVEWHAATIGLLGVGDMLAEHRRKLRTTLLATAASGFGADIEESTPGVCSVALPVRRGDRVVAALAIAMRPADYAACDRRQLLAALADTADRLSQDAPARP